MTAWHPATSAPPDRPVWAFHEGKREVWPARLATGVGFPDERLKGSPEHRFFRHAHGGQGFFARWWREIDEP